MHCGQHVMGDMKSHIMMVDAYDGTLEVTRIYNLSIFK